MSEYDEVLGHTRQWLARAPEFNGSVAELRAARRAHARRRHTSRAVASVASVVVASVWAWSILGHPIVSTTCEWVASADVVRYGLVHVTGLFVASWLIGRGQAWAQLLARALWWSGLLTATVTTLTEVGTAPVLFSAVAVASGAMLLWLEHRADGATVGFGFELSRHRSTMMLLMVLAMADTETLLAAALNHDEPAVYHLAAIDLACALAMAVAMIGLYRLRVWGLVATVGVDVVVAGLGVAGLLVYSDAFAWVMVVTAVLQVALAVPLLRTLLSGRSGAMSFRSGPRIGRVVILVLLAVGAWGTARGQDPQIVAAACAED